MDFDDKEVFETFEKEFNRKESSKRPGNRFPSWIVPLVIVFAGVVYFGTQLNRFRPAAPTETPAVDIAAFQSEEPFNSVLTETGTVVSLAEPGSNEEIGVIVENTLTPSITPSLSPSFFDRFTRLFARPTVETAVMPQPGTDAPPIEISSEPRASATPQPADLAPKLPTIGAPGTSPAETAAADSSQNQASNQIPNEADGVVVLRAPSATPMAPVAELTVPASGNNPFAEPSATITIEIPLPSLTAENKAALTDPSLPSPIETAAAGPSIPTEIVVQADGSQTDPLSTAALTPEAADQPGFFERIGAFFFKPEPTATAGPPLPTEIVVQADSSQTDPLSTAAPAPETTDEPGFFERIGAFFFEPEPTATAEPPLPTEIIVQADGSQTVLISTAAPAPEATDEPGFFERIGWFFFGAPTEDPTVEPTNDFDTSIAESPETTSEAPSAVSAGSADPKQASENSANSDLNDEPMQFPPGSTEVFYLPTSDIANPPTLIPQGFQPQQLRPTATAGIGIPLVTQIAPTRPFSNLPTVRPTQIQPFHPTQQILNPPAFRATPTVGDGIYFYPTAPGLQPQQQPHLLPTALPNTGVGDHAELPQKIFAFIGLVALIVIVRIIRRRWQNAQK